MSARGRRRSVAEAFSRVPRELFLPRNLVAEAGLNVPLPIGHGQTNSQPSTVADMLDLLDVRTGHSVLDLGSGSGWTTALLAELVGPHGRVLGVERIPELAAGSRLALAELGRGRVVIIDARPGVLGLPDRAPFDRILVSAESATLPAELGEQLRIGGVMVIPVAGRMLRVERLGEEPHANERLGSEQRESESHEDEQRGSESHEDEQHLRITAHGGYRFVPLIRDHTKPTTSAP